MSRVLREFVAVAGASLIATAADGVVYSILVWMSTRAGIAAILAAVVGGILHFSMCRWGIFKDEDSPILRSAPLYFLMSSSAALMQGGVVELGVQHTNAMAAWLVGKVLIYTFWTFPISKFVVFRGRPA